MGAETRVYVKVIVPKVEWRELHAVTLDEAKRLAAQLVGVDEVLDAQYDEPDDLYSPTD